MCNLDCFHCIHDDCIRDEKADTREQVQRWREQHPDRVKELRKKQYEKHKEKQKEYSKNYYQKHKNDPAYRAMRNENVRKCRERKKVG